MILVASGSSTAQVLRPNPQKKYKPVTVAGFDRRADGLEGRLEETRRRLDDLRADVHGLDP